jgi:hypothetical protein
VSQRLITTSGLELTTKEMLNCEKQACPGFTFHERVQIGEEPCTLNHTHISARVANSVITSTNTWSHLPYSLSRLIENSRRTYWRSSGKNSPRFTSGKTNASDWAHFEAQSGIPPPSSPRRRRTHWSRDGTRRGICIILPSLVFISPTAE